MAPESISPPGSSSNQTRRSMLAVAGSLPLNADAPVAARSVDRSAWEAATERVRLAREACDAFDRGPWMEAKARYDAARTPSPECVVVFQREDVRHAPDPDNLRWTYPSFDAVRRVYDAERRSVWDQRHKELLDRYEAWQAADEQIAEQTGYNAALDEGARLCNLLIEAEDALIETPAPDNAAVLAKFGLGLFADAELEVWAREAFEADLVRLAQQD